MLTLTFLVSIFLSTSVWAQQAQVEVTLKPVGSFKATTKDVRGFATKNGDKVEAQNIMVDLKSLKTGVDLRDDHMRKHLDVSNHPDAVLVSATGQGGQGEGLLRIKGIEMKISGTYQIDGDNLNASFPIKFSDYNISGIKYMGVGVQDKGLIHISIPLKSSQEP